MARPAVVVLHLLLALFSLLLTPVSALPAAIGQHGLLYGRAPFSGPTSAQSSMQVTDSTKCGNLGFSNGNLVLQTCTVTLTPTVINGQDEVIAVSECVITPVNGGGGSSGSATSNSTTDPGASTTTPSTDSASSTPSDSPSSASSSSGDGSATSSVQATATAGGAVVIGQTVVSVSPTGGATVTGSSSTATSTRAADAGATSSSTKTVSDSRSSATPTTSGTASPAAASAASAAVNTGLPGKNLSVLPIGLGVFAGLSVIAMVVVGFVTYERSKYRKAFRAKKLAEAGGTMGYGGMAQRV